MKNIKYQNKAIKIVDIPEPQITSPTQIKIRIAYASICGYEIMKYRSSRNTNVEYSLGHEASGMVVEIGSKVSTFSPGDFVTLNPYSFCGECENCIKGQPTYCTNPPQPHVSFMSEYVVLEQNQVYLLPDSLSLLEGCLIEPLSVCIRAVEKTQLTYKKNLLIIGGGAMGLLCLQTALTHPVENIVVLDPNPNKRAIAEELGATFALDPNTDNLYFQLMDLSKGLGFDAVIEASGDSDCIVFGYNLLARGGSLVMLSMYNEVFSFQLRPLSLYWKDASIHAVYPNYTYFPYAISLSKRLQLAKIITKIFPYMKAQDAFSDKAYNHEHAKVVLDFFSFWNQ